jgi:hypothetical protein
MEISTEQTNFSSWAIVELFGHQREIGFVTARYFGTACLFQIDVPELPEREYTLEHDAIVDDKWAPAGSVVKKKAVQARSRLVGPENTVG